MEDAGAKYRLEKKTDYLLNELFMQRQVAAMHLGALVEALGADATTKAWGQAQGFLGAASIVSLCLWPTHDDYKVRGEALRQRLNVPDDSPLRERKVRNGFQHIDERIEEWAAQEGFPPYAEPDHLAKRAPLRTWTS